MEGKWSNLFWQLHSSETPTQLEVNTTKNLLNVLRDSGPEFEQAFVDLLWNVTNSGDSPRVITTTYRREYSQTPETDVDERFLVGLSRKGKSFSPDELETVTHDGGQADASIVVETESGKFQYIIEVKTGKDKLSRTQLGKYCNKFDVDPQNVATIQWNTIYETVDGIRSTTTDELSAYLLTEFSENLQLQGLRRKVALFEHSGYEKSISIEPVQEGVSVTFQAEESGSSDRKRLSGEQFVDLFTKLFDCLQLNQEDRQKIFIEGDGKALSASVAKHTIQEVASTTVGFSGKARYRLIIDEHGSDAGLLKLQEMREDGRSAEFPNTYHFMLTDRELLRVLSPEHGPGFTKPTLEALFVDLQPETVF